MMAGVVVTSGARWQRALWPDRPRRGHVGQRWSAGGVEPAGQDMAQPLDVVERSRWAGAEYCICNWRRCRRRGMSAAAAEDSLGRASGTWGAKAWWQEVNEEGSGARRASPPPRQRRLDENRTRIEPELQNVGEKRCRTGADLGRIPERVRNVSLSHCQEEPQPPGERERIAYWIPSCRADPGVGGGTNLNNQHPLCALRLGQLEPATRVQAKKENINDAPWECERPGIDVPGGRGLDVGRKLAIRRIPVTRRGPEISTKKSQSPCPAVQLPSISISTYALLRPTKDIRTSETGRPWGLMRSGGRHAGRIEPEVEIARQKRQRTDRHGCCIADMPGAAGGTDGSRCRLNNLNHDIGQVHMSLFAHYSLHSHSLDNLQASSFNIPPCSSVLKPGIWILHDTISSDATLLQVGGSESRNAITFQPDKSPGSDRRKPSDKY
ncbi:hypothetical protein B0H15DRAFT_931717 [Mycena belliarum]|uniref:Uncharacterized protein n=1 Tax=Mycena belliarum TaxID=1033014 RepID=A0AAD6U3P2_9AGAR|nr:hypothetical protein B0H15DRAFT_931717 [Mycena belliae]